MKIKSNTGLWVNVALVIFGAFIFSQFLVISHDFPKSLKLFSKTPFYVQYDDLKAIDQPISQELPYSKYIWLKDSIRQTRDMRDGNVSASGGLLFGYFAGTGGYHKLCDTCNVLRYWRNLSSNNPNNSTQYYIKLPAWKLKATRSDILINDSVKYYVDHNQAYIRKTVIDSIKKSGNDDDHYKTHLINIPVNFRYIRWDHSIAIPVSESTKNFMDVVLYIAMFLFGVFFLVLVGVFLKFLIDLSKGLAFTNENVARLKMISISLLIYPLISLLIIFLIRLMLHNYFTPDVVLSEDIWSSTWKTILVGIVFLLLYRAFRQGKMLKEEQDLTV